MYKEQTLSRSPGIALLVLGLELRTSHNFYIGEQFVTARSVDKKRENSIARCNTRLRTGDGMVFLRKTYRFTSLTYVCDRRLTLKNRIDLRQTPLPRNNPEAALEPSDPAKPRRKKNKLGHSFLANALLM